MPDNTKTKKKKKSNIRIHKVLFIALIVYLSWTYIEQHKLKKELEVKKAKQEEQIAELEEDIKILEKEISDSDSLQFIEKVAREEMGMVKPREIIVIDKNKAK